MESEFKPIKEKGDSIPYMLLNFYLQKLCEVDMSFLSSGLAKKFGETLYKFATNFVSDRSTESYQQQIQILLVKMLDSENEHMKNFRLYRHDETKVD